MIQLQQVSKRYEGGFEALSQVSFNIPKGGMVFLTGPSGAGKSTLLKLIALIERPTTGQIMVDEENLARVDQGRIPYHRRKLGIIFQNHQLLLDRSVYDNVALPLIISGYHHRDIPALVRAALDKVGLLAKERLYPLTLSGGEQQRVGIARAIIHKPLLLLADEPTGNLDPQLALEIMKIFEEFVSYGMTLLIASHDIALIHRLKRPQIKLIAGTVTANQLERRHVLG
ncbi:MAG: cell division ATP-binding protein FtsE [Gammaproteobacteria bacterium]|nr:cell division ATP-binding protein FtsE [Gammaproteobacteria bacterium]